MKDFITNKIEGYIRYNRYNFYKIKRKLKEIGFDLDKYSLIKRIKDL